MNRKHLTINICGRLMDFNVPKIMGILNVTPDSFFRGSRNIDDSSIKNRVKQMISEGVDIIDVGGCSTRPGSEPPSVAEEMNRVGRALDIIRNISEDIPVSIDTYRAEIASRAIDEWNVSIVNDISGGNLNSQMWSLVAEKGVAYVLTHSKGSPACMQELTEYEDVTANVLTDLSKKSYELRKLGVKDIILDPGFGFAKTVEGNFQLLDELNYICETGFPVLAGLSRKSMIWKTLDCTPEDSLEGTVALNMIALERGADILRVHDVKEAANIIRLNKMLHPDKNKAL